MDRVKMSHCPFSLSPNEVVRKRKENNIIVYYNIWDTFDPPNLRCFGSFFMLAKKEQFQG